MDLGSFESLAVAMSPSPPLLELCEPPTFVDSGGVLAPNSQAIYEKELCDLLVSLEAVTLDMTRRLLASWRGMLLMT
jgi:hypothetical protein